jgi:uncharacterized protein YdeI (YjbR/CyaY-like superfamily)
MNKDISKTPNPKVDEYFRDKTRWREELQTLRAIVVGCGLKEELKWRAPCYTHQGANVILLSALKEYCAISFMKGALLKDEKGMLVKPGENSRAARLIRFTNANEIVDEVPLFLAVLQVPSIH